MDFTLVNGTFPLQTFVQFEYDESKLSEDKEFSNLLVCIHLQFQMEK